MSPYENRLHAEIFRRVGLLSLVKPGCDDALIRETQIVPPEVAARLASAGLANVNLFVRRIDMRSFVFVFLESQATDVETVAGQFRADPWIVALARHLEPHPRSDRNSHPWLRMELMNVIGPTLPLPADESLVQRAGLVASLKPESELWYRTLHQTNWPGVIDQMARSHYRCWITFLVEFGADLQLFTYCEHVGGDKQADDAAMAADPVTQRWWKHTEPCLAPVAGGATTWSPMKNLARVHPHSTQP